MPLVGGRPPGGTTPPTSEMLSRQTVLAAAWPPNQNASCPLPAAGKSNVDVKVTVKCWVAGVTVKSVREICRYGDTASPATAEICWVVVACASKVRVYGCRASIGTPFWPDSASYPLAVPPGTSVQNSPPVTRPVVPAPAHHGSVVPPEKVPLSRRS